MLPSSVAWAMQVGFRKLLVLTWAMVGILVWFMKVEYRQDERYSKYIGSYCASDFWQACTYYFRQGLLKISPGLDHNDYLLARKLGLPILGAIVLKSKHYGCVAFGVVVCNSMSGVLFGFAGYQAFIHIRAASNVI